MTHTTLHAKESQPAMAPDRRNRRLHRIVMTAMMIGASVMLAGCGTNKDNMSTGAIPDDYRTRHPITLNEVEHTLDIPIASGDHRLSNGVQDSIGGFATDYLSTSSGSIQIMLPQGSANAGAAANVRAQIRKVLTAKGVQANRIIETSYQASATGDAAPVRLSYVAITAVTNQCGEWPEDLQNNTFSNTNYHNFGCASQSNIAAQIANPMDLVTPRAVAPIDATRRSTVIGLYREGSDTSTE
ncbi:pilus (Caulobacter type) biogenesis lipoprotein CpaD [Rhizobium sp. PDO1-076]|nr:pilus (Caulobacter type) biogenesis lipoprotein CpaD [Rhizobium sp. PDO1-076]